MSRKITPTEALGELGELRGRVVALEIRTPDGAVIARAEGELSRLEGSSSTSWSVELGGKAPPARGGVHFIVASWLQVEIPQGGVTEAWDETTPDTLGPAVSLRLRLGTGIDIAVWPAMPPEDQWTERHDATR